MTHDIVSVGIPLLNHETKLLTPVGNWEDEYRNQSLSTIINKGFIPKPIDSEALMEDNNLPNSFLEHKNIKVLLFLCFFNAIL
jgi:hypothetical protein